MSQQHTRPLYRVIVDADAALIDGCLKATKDLKDTRYLTSDTLAEFTDRCMKQPLIVYKLYCLFIWIILHDRIREYFAKGEDASKFQQWLGDLQYAFDQHVVGRKPDGSMYTDLNGPEMTQSLTPCFVHRMIVNYTDL